MWEARDLGTKLEALMKENAERLSYEFSIREVEKMKALVILLRDAYSENIREIHVFEEGKSFLQRLKELEDYEGPWSIMRIPYAVFFAVLFACLAFLVWFLFV